MMSLFPFFRTFKAEKSNFLESEYVIRRALFLSQYFMCNCFVAIDEIK